MQIKTLLFERNLFIDIFSVPKRDDIYFELVLNNFINNAVITCSYTKSVSAF